MIDAVFKPLCVCSFTKIKMTDGDLKTKNCILLQFSKKTVDDDDDEVEWEDCEELAEWGEVEMVLTVHIG